MVKAINKIRHKFTTHADGSDALLFIHELVGESDGPTIGISASIHGNENAGSQAIVDLYRTLKDMKLKGRVLLLPVANPRAFAVNHRFTPLDELNLNRVFPGDDRGNYPSSSPGRWGRNTSTRSRQISTCIPAPIGRPSTTSTSGATRDWRGPLAARSSTGRRRARPARSIPAPPRR